MCSPPLLRICLHRLVVLPVVKARQDAAAAAAAGANAGADAAATTATSAAAAAAGAAGHKKQQAAMQEIADGLYNSAVFEMAIEVSMVQKASTAAACLDKVGRVLGKVVQVGWGCEEVVQKCELKGGRRV